MVKKKAKKYEGGGIIHDTIPGWYNSLTGKINPRSEEDVKAAPAPEPRRIQAQEESDPLGDTVNEVQAVRSAPAPRPAPRSAPAATPAPRRAAPVASNADIDIALAEAAAQTQMDYDNPRRRPTGPGRYDMNGPIGDARELLARGANRRAAKRAAEKVGVSAFKKGGSVKSSASKRADGCAQRGKTKGRMV